MHDALEEALKVLDELRSAVASNESRPSAEEICVALTHVMALVVGYRQANTLPPEPTLPPGPTISDLEAVMAWGDVVTIEPDGTAHASRVPDEDDRAPVPE